MRYANKAHGGRRRNAPYGQRTWLVATAAVVLGSLATGYVSVSLGGAASDATPASVGLTPASGEKDQPDFRTDQVLSYESPDVPGTMIYVPGTVTYDESAMTATFVPESSMDYDTEYTATIRGTITDLAGNPMGDDYACSFSTEPEPDATAPSVASAEN